MPMTERRLGAPRCGRAADMAARRDPVFRLPGDASRADLALLRIAAVTMVSDRALFDACRARLRALDYAEIFLRFETLDGFRRELSAGLKWREQFGYAPWTGNLDALNDGFRDPPSFSGSGGLVVAIDGFDALMAAEPRTATVLLDIIECQSRNHLLYGRRLIALIRSDARQPLARLTFGGRGPNWLAAG
ncbi:hypothetical protein [Phreatobacter sp. AB_2022a]|uniref:hypothetical protein n=1 Tax=Phreatobacter sp. AB_2022a TaxID=3003134 RepID=UPI003FA7E709